LIDRPGTMRRTLQFLGLMAGGLLLAGTGMLVYQALSGGALPRPGARSAAGIDYVSFGIGLALGLMLAEIARLSWADMPRRAIAWMIANRRNAKYCAYGMASVVVLFYL
jgi:hypothetical protein